MLAILRRWCRSTTAICLLLRLKAATRARHRAFLAFDRSREALLTAAARYEAYLEWQPTGVLLPLVSDARRDGIAHGRAVNRFRRRIAALEAATERERRLALRLSEAKSEGVR